MMGGNIGLGNVTPASEFNFYTDPDAAKIVFKSGITLCMSPVEICAHINNEICKEIKSWETEFSE